MPFDAEYAYTPRERLLLIADALDDVQTYDLDLGSWTTCALGWGIRKHGAALRMKLARYEGVTAPFLDGTYLFNEPCGALTTRPWRRLAKHLGISEATARELFGGAPYKYTANAVRNPTPKEAADCIRWVADHAMVPAGA